MKQNLLIITIIVILVIPSLVNADLGAEGETIEIGGRELQIFMVADNSRTVVFKLDGKLSKALQERETYEFFDGSRITIGDVLIEEAGDGADLVEFYFSPAFTLEKTSYDDIIYELPSPESLEAEAAGQYLPQYNTLIVADEPSGFDEVIARLYSFLDK